MFQSLFIKQICRTEMRRLCFPVSKNIVSLASINSSFTHRKLEIKSQHIIGPLNKYQNNNIHSSSINLTKENDSKTENKTENPGIVKKFKQMMKDYWYVLIPVHVATSIVW